MVKNLDQAMYELACLREERVENLRSSLNNPGPQTINELIADAINSLEAIYLCINIPTDGFASFTPERRDDSS
jgi:predicted DNA-binding protein